MPATTTTRSRFLGIAVLAASLVGGAAHAAPPLDETSGTRRVCAGGPGAALARAQRLRGEASVAAASVLPNPDLVVEHQRTLRGPTDQETTVGLAVSLGIGGRRFLLQDAAQARREQALADARATSFAAALAFREAFAAAVLERERLAVLEQQQRELDALTSAVERLAKGGESAKYDLLRQSMQARLHRRLVESMRGRAASSLALLEVWTGETVALAAADPASLAGGTRASGKSAPIAEPRIASAEAAARSHGLEAAAARRRWVPDLGVFAGYRAQVGAGSETGHGISLGLEVPITLFDHGQGEAAVADAEAAVAAATAEELRRGAAARARAARARLTVLEASVAEADRAAGEAMAIQRAATQLYAAGEASIADLLDAFRASEEARLARLDLAEEIVAARLARMSALGSLLDDGLDRACLGDRKGTGR